MTHPELLMIADAPFFLLEAPPDHPVIVEVEEDEGENNHMTMSPRQLPLLPMPNYIKDFEPMFNSQRFSDLHFVFRSNAGVKVLNTHKVVLARSIPMRNFLLLQGENFDTILVPSSLDFHRFGCLLQGFYYDGDGVRARHLGFTSQELPFIESLFGPIDQYGYIPCRPLDIHFPGLIGAKRFSDALWVARNGHSFPIHRLLLCARSEYFASVFEAGLEETYTKMLRLPEVGTEIVKLLIKFIYYDKSSDWLDPEVLLEVLYTSDRLQLTVLRDRIVEELLRGFEEGTIDAENVLPVLEAAHNLHIPILRQACLALAINNFFQIQDQDEFVTLSPELKKELKILADLQNNPLGARSICCAKEMLAMLKESLEIQQYRLEQVKEQYTAKMQAFDEDDEILTDEVREGRLLFLKHWHKLIETQETRVLVLHNYIHNHEKIFESVQNQ